MTLRLSIGMTICSPQISVNPLGKTYFQDRSLGVGDLPVAKQATLAEGVPVAIILFLLG